MKPGEVVDVCGGYRLVKRLGAGGFAEVWEVESLQSGIKAALKVLIQPVDNEESQREMQSLEVIKNIRHPYLLQTRDFARWNDRMVVVMDLADGSLRDRLKTYAREHRCGLPADELVRYFYEAAEALDFLHGLNIIHRDIKPDNLLLRAGHVVVCDFGLVRLKDRLMMSVSSSGTPAYMAPETWHGRAGAATDQYALAATYAELRLNRRPFQANDYAGIMIDHLQSQPILDPMPAPEQQVILRAMAKEPSQRYPSCLTMVQALAEVAPGAVISRRFGTSTPSAAVTGGPGGGAQETMIRQYPQHTMPRADFPQITNLASEATPSRPNIAGVPTHPAANTPSSVHGLATQQGPRPAAPPSAYGPTIGQAPPQGIDQSLSPNPLATWDNPPGSGSFQTAQEAQGGFGAPAPQHTAPGVSLPSRPAYPPQPGQGPPPNYPPQPNPYGTMVSGPDMFVEVGPDQGAMYAQPYPPLQPAPPPPSRLPLIALLIGLSGLVLLGGVAVVWYVLQPKPDVTTGVASVTLQPPPEVKLKPGVPQKARISVQRKGYAGALKLSFSPLANVTIVGAEVAAGRDDLEVQLEANAQAAPGKHVVSVTATPTQGEAQKANWTIVIEESATTPPVTAWVPPGFQAVGTETLEAGGKRWYKQIEKSVAGGSKVVLCLVPATPPFYLAQDKVSNEVFRAFVEAHPGTVHSPWSKGGIAAGNDVGSADGKLPVLRLSHNDAKAAATWLGGTLPSVAQLDFAATLEQPRDAAVNRRELGPVAVGSTVGDRSKYDIRDLAGNGWEWTTDEMGGAVVLRGQRYTARQPLTPEALQQQLKEPFTCAPEHASPLIGFRVVLPTPK